MPSASNLRLAQVRAIVRSQLLRWVRSRAALGLVGFVLVLLWYDRASLDTSGGTPWWQTVVFIAAWSGFLVGYDSFERLRSEGSLRLLLLRPVPRFVLALGAFGGSLIAALVVFGLPIAYVIAFGRVASLDALLSGLPLIVIGMAGFIAYAQAASVVLPRDASAVLGVIVLFFGSTPSDRWVPSTAPAAVRVVVDVVWNALPTSLRLSETLNGESTIGNSFAMAAYVAVGLAACATALSRRGLVGRRETV